MIFYTHKHNITQLDRQKLGKEIQSVAPMLDLRQALKRNLIDWRYTFDETAGLNSLSTAMRI
eukprot:1323438-Amorphochlora_amoeboformis.AAC.1